MHPVCIVKASHTMSLCTLGTIKDLILGTLVPILCNRVRWAKQRRDIARDIGGVRDSGPPLQSCYFGGDHGGHTSSN